MQRSGFTLVELSIVLVIIGLIVGGVLVGRDLITAAELRAQISQFEKYTATINTFRLKYGYLPGDIPEPAASSFGFVARGAFAGEGDGNGILTGICANAASSNYGNAQAAGEVLVFWRDLSAANLIEGNFATASSTSWALSVVTANTSPALKDYYPVTKMYQDAYFYAWSWDTSNYLTAAAVTNVGTAFFCGMSGNGAFTPTQAFSIDSKMDDGLPQTGRMNVRHLSQQNGPNYSGYWSAGSGAGANPGGGAVASASTCYDNGGAGTFQYSLSPISNNRNCALSLRF